MKKSIIRKRLLQKLLFPDPSKMTMTALERGMYVLSLAEQGYTLNQIGKHLGKSRQRVYQYIQEVDLETALNLIVQQRRATRRMEKVKNRFRFCKHCGKRYYPLPDFNSPKYCTPECSKDAEKKWRREYARKRYHQDGEYRAKALARGYLRFHKPKLDINK